MKVSCCLFRPYASRYWTLSYHIFTLRQLKPLGRALLVPREPRSPHAPISAPAASFLHSARVCPAGDAVVESSFPFMTPLLRTSWPCLSHGDGRKDSWPPCLPPVPPHLAGGRPQFREAVWIGTYKAGSQSLLGTRHRSCDALSTSAADTTFLCPSRLPPSPASFWPEDALTLALVKLGAASTGAGWVLHLGRGLWQPVGLGTGSLPPHGEHQELPRGLTQRGSGRVCGGRGRVPLPVGHRPCALDTWPTLGLAQHCSDASLREITH